MNKSDDLQQHNDKREQIYEYKASLRSPEKMLLYIVGKAIMLVIFISSEMQTTVYVTRIRSITMINTHVITNITSHVKQEVLELSEYIAVARTLARPVLAKLCSMAFSVESSTCKPAIINSSV